MIWMDFGILCIGQEQISVPSNMTNVDIEWEQRCSDSEPLYYEEHFHTADKLLGYRYKIWLPDPICYEESFFDIAPKGIPYVEVVPKWSACVKSLLAFYISQSPVNRVVILLRVQDVSDDTVHSDCSLDEFVRMLTEGNVKWNELYFVHS